MSFIIGLALTSTAKLSPASSASSWELKGRLANGDHIVLQGRMPDATYITLKGKGA